MPRSDGLHSVVKSLFPHASNPKESSPQLEPRVGPLRCAVAVPKYPKRQGRADEGVEARENDKGRPNRLGRGKSELVDDRRCRVAAKLPTARRIPPGWPKAGLSYQHAVKRADKHSIPAVSSHHLT